MKARETQVWTEMGAVSAVLFDRRHKMIHVKAPHYREHLLLSGSEDRRRPCVYEDTLSNCSFPAIGGVTVINELHPHHSSWTLKQVLSAEVYSESQGTIRADAKSDTVFG